MNSEGSDKVIGLLQGSGGFVDEIIIPGVRSGKMHGKALLVIDADPKVLVDRLLAELKIIRA
jgi:hypothetical protein